MKDLLRWILAALGIMLVIGICEAYPRTVLVENWTSIG